MKEYFNVLQQQLFETFNTEVDPDLVKQIVISFAAGAICFILLSWFVSKAEDIQADESDMEDDESDQMNNSSDQKKHTPSGMIEITSKELRLHDGSIDGKPIYIGIKGKIYDVSDNSAAYGPGGSYAVFTGKDASKALGKSSLDIDDCVADISDLSEKELSVLADWEKYFQNKYTCVGKIVDDEKAKI